MPSDGIYTYEERKCTILSLKLLELYSVFILEEFSDKYMFLKAGFLYFLSNKSFGNTRISSVLKYASETYTFADSGFGGGNFEKDYIGVNHAYVDIFAVNIC